MEYPCLQNLVQALLHGLLLIFHPLEGRILRGPDLVGAGLALLGRTRSAVVIRRPPFRDLPLIFLVLLLGAADLLSTLLAWRRGRCPLDLAHGGGVQVRLQGDLFLLQLEHPPLQGLNPLARCQDSWQRLAGPVLHGADEVALPLLAQSQGFKSCQRVGLQTAPTPAHGPSCDGVSSALRR